MYYNEYGFLKFVTRIDTNILNDNLLSSEELSISSF